MESAHSLLKRNGLLQYENFHSPLKLRTHICVPYRTKTQTFFKQHIEYVAKKFFFLKSYSSLPYSHDLSKLFTHRRRAIFWIITIRTKVSFQYIFLPPLSLSISRFFLRYLLLLHFGLSSSHSSLSGNYTESRKTARRRPIEWNMKYSSGMRIACVRNFMHLRISK